MIKAYIDEVRKEIRAEQNDLDKYKIFCSRFCYGLSRDGHFNRANKCATFGVTCESKIWEVARCMRDGGFLEQ